MDENAICSAIVVEDRFYFTKDFSLTAGLRYDNFYRDTETSDKTFDDITWPIAANWDVTESVSFLQLLKGSELHETFIQY